MDMFYHFRRWKLGIKLSLEELKSLRHTVEGSDAFAKDVAKIDEQIHKLEH